MRAARAPDGSDRTLAGLPANADRNEKEEVVVVVVDPGREVGAAHHARARARTILDLIKSVALTH